MQIKVTLRRDLWRGHNRASAKVLEAHAIGGSAIWAVGALALSGEHDLEADAVHDAPRSNSCQGWKNLAGSVDGGDSDAPPSGAKSDPCFSIPRPVPHDVDT
jgi:hypothetical protein